MSDEPSSLSEAAARAVALAELDILDSPPEPGFDEIARLAALICETPVALVGFLDRDRQWFKAGVGFEACETALDQSVCAQVLRDPAPSVTIIPDLGADARTREVRLVAGGAPLRFYAGARLVTSQGQALGTLCVLDHTPRPQGLTTLQTQALAELSRQVMRRLGSRRAAAAQAASDRRGAEQARRERDQDRQARARSETRYQTLFNSIDQGFCVIEFLDGPHGPDSDYVHVEANPAYLRHTGFKTIVGVRLRDLVGEEADRWAERYGQVLRTGNSIRFEQELEATGRWLEVTAHRVEPPGLRQVAVLFSDISARKQAEFELWGAHRALVGEVNQRAQERERMWATSPDLMMVTDFDGYVREVNPAWTTVLGHAPDALVGRHVTAFVLPDDHAETAEANSEAAGGGVIRFVNRCRHKDGSTRWISWAAAPAKDETYATGRDITAEKLQAAALLRAEEQLRQSQKMEAVGQLTGGLAHDFNNLLAGISGSLELMQSRMQQGRIADIERYMAAAQAAAKRAAALTHRLLAFSRRQTLDPRPTNVNRLVHDMQELIQRTVGPAISVEVVGASGLWSALVDPSQLENALLNLCINARDAMPDGGRITVETANTRLDACAARQHDLPEGPYLSMCVTDTGTGMAPDVIAHAFEPFFTTKPIGEGTGLGLSMIYGFAQQSGGQVRIRSRVGAGTTVCIHLPRHGGEVADEINAADRAVLPASDRGATVLIVDDEPTVRMLVTEILHDLGHTAIEASDSAAGLEILQSDARIDLLITDVGLPGGMNGRQMADAARVKRGDLKVLFITGYAETAALGSGQLAPGMAVLTKPFSLDTMAARILSLVEAGMEAKRQRSIVE